MLLLLEVRAGTFSADFNSGKPPDLNVYGSTAVVASGGFGNSGVLKLTGNSNNQQGSVVIDDLDRGETVASFTAAFKLRIGGGTGADGFSFNFAPDLPRDVFGEEGAGTGLTVSFDTSDNGNREAPAIDVKFGGVLLASKKIDPRTGDNFVDVVINVGPDGGLDLIYGTTVVYTNLFAYVPFAGRFGLGARTGGANDNHLVDDLKITTSLLGGPYVKSVTPRGINVRPDVPVTIELQDSGRQVNPASIKLALNGADVAPVVSKDSGLSTIRIPTSGLLPSGSTNSIQLSFEDNSLPPRSSTAHFVFVVQKYITIPSSYALGVNAMDTNRIGFKVRSVQARGDIVLPATIARAEAQLAGTLIDPTTNQPYQNEAIPGPNADKTYAEEQVINFQQDEIPVGNFIEGDEAVPGIPGTGGHAANFSTEILGFLALSAGYYTFGVNSDDGFKVVVGDKDARDAFSLVLGQYDGARSVGDSIFSFVNESPGLVPFRIVWFETVGEASLEFFSVLDDGTRVLINDRNDTNSVKAFRELKAGVATFPFVQSVSPGPGEIRVSKKPQISVALKDQGSQAVVDSIQLALNGALVKPTVAKTNGLTSINFQPEAALPYSSSNSLKLSFRDNANPSNVFTREWQFVTTPEISPTGQWDFESGGLSPTFGLALEYGDGPAKEVSSLTDFGTTASFGIPDIGGQAAKVMRFRRNSVAGAFQPGFVLTHGIAPNGGGSKVNQWTLIMDVLFPEPQTERFTSLIQTDDPTSDADLFVRWNNIGGAGTGGLGANGQFTGDGRTFLTKGRWHRIAVAADLTSDSPVISKFIDGVKFEDQYLIAPQLDGRFALGKTLRLFADENNQVNTLYVNSIQVLAGKLIDDEIASLGGPSAGGIPHSAVATPPTSSPALGVRWVGASLVISWPTDVTGFSLESSDNPASSTWTPVSGVSNNSATVLVDTKARFFRLRR